MGVIIDDLIKLLKSQRFNLEDEKRLQADIFKTLEGFCVTSGIELQREIRLDSHNIVDFLLTSKSLGAIFNIHGFYKNICIEVKLTGQKRAIYRQCENYCQFPQIDELLLITNTSMGFPRAINGKPTYYLNLGKAWL